VTTHLVVNKNYLMQHRGVIRNLIVALVEVTEQINQDKVAARSILNEQLRKETGKNLKNEVMEKALSRVEFTWDPICSSLKRSAEASYRVGLIKKAPELGGIYSLTFLNDVLKEKDLAPVPEPAP